MTFIHAEERCDPNELCPTCNPAGCIEDLKAQVTALEADKARLLERADALELALQDVLTWVPACTARDRARTALAAYRGTT